MLNSLFLIHEGLLSMPILYLSRYVIRNKPEYYERLLDVTRRGAWEPWLLYMLEAVHETSEWTLAKIEAIRELADTTVDRVRSHLPKIYSRELIDELFMQSYCRIDNLVQAGVARRQTASRYLKLLVDMGILEERKVGREKLFLHTALLSLLTDEARPSQDGSG